MSELGHSESRVLDASPLEHAPAHRGNGHRVAAAIAVLPEQMLAFTIPQFCGMHNVSRSVTYEEIAAGRLKTFKVGRRRLIAAEDAAAWRRLRREMTEAEEAGARG